MKKQEDRVYLRKCRHCGECFRTPLHRGRVCFKCDIRTKLLVKPTLILFLLISVIGFASSMYAGETNTFTNEMGIENLVYAIIGNSTPVFPVVEINRANITIHLPSDATPDNFSFVFIEEKTNTVVQTIYTGGGRGGGTRTKYVDRNITRNIPIYTNVEVIKEIPVEKIVEVSIGDGNHTITYFLIFVLIVMAIILYFVLFRRSYEDGI